jgi:transmembrane sensor
MDFVELARGEPDVAEEERRMADVQAAPTNERKPDRLLTRAALLFASAPRRSLSFAVAVFFFAMVSAVWFSHSPRWYADHYTAVGEQASVALADDSTVQLNTNTALFVDFSSRTRRVTLHAGEAFFTITPDPVRPFVVQTAGGEVHVLGTAFNVRIDDESVQVSVSTNCVRVTLDDSSAGKEIAAGQRLVYSSTGFWGEVEAVDVSRLTAWRWQRLIFEDQKLIDVVHELIRVTPTKPCERLKKLCRFTADGLLIFS